MSKGKPEPAAGHCHLGQKAVGLPGQLLCLQGKAAVPTPEPLRSSPDNAAAHPREQAPRAGSSGVSGSQLWPVSTSNMALEPV